MHRIDIPPGTLEMLILRTLLAGPRHGYAIAKDLRNTSDGVLQVEEGSLYPALQRLLRKGLVTAEWVAAGPKRRARVYHLTASGQQQFQAEVNEFTHVMQTILRVIQPA